MPEKRDKELARLIKSLQLPPGESGETVAKQVADGWSEQVAREGGTGRGPAHPWLWGLVGTLGGLLLAALLVAGAVYLYRCQIVCFLRNLGVQATAMATKPTAVVLATVTKTPAPGKLAATATTAEKPTEPAITATLTATVSPPGPAITETPTATVGPPGPAITETPTATVGPTKTTVPECPSILGLTLGISPTQAYIGAELSFTAAVTTGLPIYAWDFIDGSAAVGEQVTHTYDFPGRYDVKLTATDEQAKCAVEASKTVAVAVWPAARAGSGGARVFPTADYDRAKTLLLLSAGDVVDLTGHSAERSGNLQFLEIIWNGSATWLNVQRSSYTLAEPVADPQPCDSLDSLFAGAVAVNESWKSVAKSRVYDGCKRVVGYDKDGGMDVVVLAWSSDGEWARIRIWGKQRFVQKKALGK